MKLAARPRALALGLVAFGLGATLYAISLPYRESRFKTRCQSNLKGLGLAMLQYTRDYDETFMLARNWKEGLSPYARSFRAPNPEQGYACPKTTRYYAFNAGFDGALMTLVNQPAEVAIFYEPSRPVNADGGGNWATKGIHEDGSNVCFHDGHVKWLQTKPIFWVPELAGKERAKRKRELENQQIMAELKAQQEKARQAF